MTYRDIKEYHVWFAERYRHALRWRWRLRRKLRRLAIEGDTEGYLRANTKLRKMPPR